MTSTPQFPVDPATGLKTESFAIATFEEADGRPFPALVHPDGQVVDLSERYSDTHAIFDAWATSFDQLADVWTSGRDRKYHVEDLRPRTPLSHPNLMCTGANYKVHVAQMLTRNAFNQHNRKPGETDDAFYERNLAMMERRQREGTPYFWTGLHSSLVGAQDDVVLPLLGEEPDWELELGVVIGGTGRYLTPDEAPSLIAGYTIINDIGTVDIFRRTDIPWQYDWVSKHQPTFKPMGPFIVPAAFFTLDETIRIELKVNDQVMQDWPADDMVFRPEHLVTYASERVRLLPGDVIAMGSPPGNGKHHGRFLQDGDVMDASITYLGRQKNRCVAEQVGRRTPHFGHWTNA